MQQKYFFSSSVPNPSVAENEEAPGEVKLHDLVWIKEGVLTHLDPDTFFGTQNKEQEHKHLPLLCLKATICKHLAR